MTHWIRYKHNNNKGLGVLVDDLIHIYSGELFANPQPVGETIPLTQVEVLPPCEPKKFLALWNNFYSRAEKEGWDIPPEPLYFTKVSSCFNAHGKDIVRPAEYDGPIYFEGELGIVIGKTCRQVAENAIEDHIFGYTCVNDVTAKEVLQRDPSFPQWTRAKGYDSFGVFGPVIATGIEPDDLIVESILDGEVKQQYPVTDMVFRPRKLVSVLSHYMTLEPGDVIACGTGLGACAMRNGQTIEICINGIGALRNTMHG